MKVVLLSPGKSSHTHKWAMFYIEQGIEVTVITFKDHYSEKNAKEVPTITLPKLLPGKLSYILSIFALRKILSKIKPDVLHAHFASSYGLVGAFSNYKPFFVSVWGTDIYQFPQKSSFNRKLIEFTLNKADVICSTSEIMAVETGKYVNKPIEVTPFGVDLSLFYPEHRDPRMNFKIGIAKGLEDKYGFRDLFAAFSILSKQLNIELMIIGDGPMFEEYQKISQNLGIDKNTKFVGRVENVEVPKYIRDLDLVVLPSYEDSFGVTAVEAMACGVPVVAYDADGLKEVILNQQTGIIVPKGQIEQLANEIKRLLLDDSLRKEMGNNGVKHVQENYDWQENAGRMVKLYKKVIY